MANREVTMKDLEEAFSAGTLLVYTSGETWSAERVKNAFDEWLGEDRVDLGEITEEEGLAEDIQTFYNVLEIARDELVDAALSNNLSRVHHLESAVASFEDVAVLLRAGVIVRELLDTTETEEVPADDSDRGI